MWQRLDSEANASVLRLVIVLVKVLPNDMKETLPARRAVPGKMVNSQLTPTQNREAPNMPDIQG
jgi:hypothetical protein